MELITITGIIASVFTATSLLPQLIKLFKEKKAEHVSIGMLVVLFIGLVFWIWYGILKKDLIIILSNSFSLTINTLIMVLSFKYSYKNK